MTNYQFLVALGILFLADALTTIYVIKHQGGREMNPGISRLMAEMGVNEALFAMKSACFGVIAWQVDALPDTVRWSGIAFYVGLVAWNIVQINKGRKQ